MKYQEAQKHLSQFNQEELYKEARKLYNSELDSLLNLRCPKGDPSSGVIESCLTQVSTWFLKVSKGLSWSDPKTPENIIKWERGGVWLRYKKLDPKLASLRVRTQRNLLRGSPFPLLEAMQPGDLEAASSFIMAKTMQDLQGALAVLEAKKRIFAEERGFQVMPS